MQSKWLPAMHVIASICSGVYGCYMQGMWSLHSGYVVAMCRRMWLVHAWVCGETNDFPAVENARVSNCLLHDLQKNSSRSHTNKELLCPLVWSSNRINKQLNFCEILAHDTTAFTAVKWWCSEIWLELPTLWERGLCIRLVLHNKTNYCISW